MNDKNFEYLRDQVKYTGFGEGLENELRDKLQQQPQDFNLYINPKYEKDTLAVALQFNKSKQSDMYFFNSYRISLKKEDSPDIMEQTFYINKGNNITFKEAYNLMSGRAVNKDLTNKEGQLYNAWVQMDFKSTDPNGNYKLKHFHQNYGYDLEAVLAKHPILELKNEKYKANLIESLKKGNRQSVSFQQDKEVHKYFIEANPRFKSINIYDENMQRLGNRQSNVEKQGEGESQSIKQQPKKEIQNQGDDNPEMPKQSKKKRKKQIQSVA